MVLDDYEEELLTLIGLCGDFPNTLIKDLPGGRSWKYKTLQTLQEMGLIKRYKKDGLHSLRLTKSGSRYLWQKYPERFEQQQRYHLRYQQSDLRKRQRLHDIATAQIMFHQAAIPIFSDQKPAVFARLPKTGEKAVLTTPCFYTSFELKTQYDETVKIKSTRAVGALLSSAAGYMVYNVRNKVIKWTSTSERRLFSVMEGALLNWQIHYDHLEAIMLGANQDTAYKQLLSDGGYRNTYFHLDQTYPAFYFVTTDPIGMVQLKLICQPLARQKLKRYLCHHFDLTVSTQMAVFNYDALFGDAFVLFAYEGDLEKIKQFKAGLEQFSEQGLVICLEEQSAMLTRYFADLALIKTIPVSLLERALASG